MKTQTKKRSFIEAWVNVIVGLGISILLQRLLFPLYGWDITLDHNIQLSLIFTVFSVIRSYGLRRMFNWWDGRV